MQLNKFQITMRRLSWMAILLCVCITTGCHT